jgi:hypothetical protein
MSRVRAGGRQYRWILVLALIAMPARLFATILLTFQSVPGGVSIVGAGTGIGVLSFGTVSAFETLGAGVSRTNNPSDYRVSTQFGVRTVKVLGASTSYTLQARLQSSSAVTWLVDGVTMSTSPAVVATLQPYGSTLSHTLTFVVPHTLAAGAISSTFEVTAIAN